MTKENPQRFVRDTWDEKVCQVIRNGKKKTKERLSLSEYIQELRYDLKEMT